MSANETRIGAEKRALIAGNWKMNGHSAAADVFDAIAAGLAARASVSNGKSDPEALICPPATLLFGFAERVRTAVERGARLAVGGQDCHPEASGAFTGDLSAEMLADAGAGAVIVGHSERREAYGEDDALVRSKAAAALRAGLRPIICVGETEAQRREGRALEVITAQAAASTPALDQAARAAPFALAYEPVWAIGTGLTPTVDDVADAHSALREALVARFGDVGRAAPILYGGSVKPANAAELLNVPEVGGALVGGASLKAEDFLAILDAAPR